jgi:hypothetical protein
LRRHDEYLGALGARQGVELVRQLFEPRRTRRKREKHEKGSVIDIKAVADTTAIIKR